MEVVQVRKVASEIGKDMGLSGTDLINSVNEAVFDAKAEADAARKEAASAKKEAEAARKKREAEAARREREAEADRKMREQETARQHELENDHKARMAELEVAHNPDQAPTNPFSGMGGPQIKLPKFDEERDSFDAFIARFESMATCQKWPKDQWAIYLSSLLSGKALEVVHRMKVHESVDFDKVKEELMHKFRLTRQGFRMKFRTVRPEKGEIPHQFGAKVENYYDKG